VLLTQFLHIPFKLSDKNL